MSTRGDRSSQLPDRAGLWGSQTLVSPLMTQALIRLLEQTAWVNQDVRERAEREEKVDVEGETSKRLCAAFLSCDPKTGASVSCASIQTEASRRMTVVDTHESRVICKHCPPQQTVCYKKPIKSKPRLRMLHGVGQILVPVKSREALPMETCSVLFTPSLATPLLEAFRVCKR